MITRLVQMINTTVPYAWDDSLTVYEFLGKILGKVNEVVEFVNGDMSEQIAAAITVELEDFTIEQLGIMITTGRMSEIILAHVEAVINPVVAEVTAARGDKATLKARLDNVEGKIDNFSLGEVIDARGGKVDLNERLVGIETRVSDIGVNVKDYGAVGNGIVDDTIAIQSAINTGLNVFVPKGVYKITGSITLKHRNFIGAGPNSTVFDIVGGFHAFLITSSEFTDKRNSCEIKGFAVKSSNNSTASKYAFYAPGVADNGVMGVYSFGINFSDIEIGTTDNGYGGGFYFSDCFRINVNKVGMTSVRNPVRLYGSVVQSTFKDIVNNADNAPGGGSLENIGFIAGVKYYSHGLSLPEGIQVDGLRMVKNDIGIAHRGGLFFSYENLDLDFCKTMGIYISHAAKIRNAYIASNNSSSKFTGIWVDVQDTSDPMGIIIDRVQFVSYNSLGAGSLAIMLGDGGVGEGKEFWGVTIRDCFLDGGLNSWTKGIMADRGKGMTIENNHFRRGRISGMAIDATYTKFAKITGNIFPGGTIHLESPNARGFGEITCNQCTVTTDNIVTPGNWLIERNIDYIQD